MVQKRTSFGENTNIVLFEQVNGICPLCDTPLMYHKNSAKYKKYHIAHIYPLNPKPDEVELLKDEEKLSDDVNHDDNLIPLCAQCHGMFDKPRTIDEYRHLVSIKKNLIAKSNQRDLWHQYNIEDDICRIVESLYAEDISVEGYQIEFESKELDRKIDDSMSNLTRQKIKNNVSDYFGFIKSRFAAIDADNPGIADIISMQIKIYYLKQRERNIRQQEIYSNVVDWIFKKTNPQSTEAADALASFFVQNCEVFE